MTTYGDVFKRPDLPKDAKTIFGNKTKQIMETPLLGGKEVDVEKFIQIYGFKEEPTPRPEEDYIHEENTVYYNPLLAENEMKFDKMCGLVNALRKSTDKTTPEDKADRLFLAIYAICPDKLFDKAMKEVLSISAFAEKKEKEGYCFIDDGSDMQIRYLAEYLSLPYAVIAIKLDILGFHVVEVN